MYNSCQSKKNLWINSCQYPPCLVDFWVKELPGRHKFTFSLVIYPECWVINEHNRLSFNNNNLGGNEYVKRKIFCM